MPMEGDCVSYPLLLVSDILLGLEKNKTKSWESRYRRDGFQFVEVTQVLP